MSTRTDTPTDTAAGYPKRPSGPQQHPFSHSDIDYLAGEWESAHTDPDWRRTPFELEDGSEILIDFDQVADADEIVQHPERLIVEDPDEPPAPDVSNRIELHHWYDPEKGGEGSRKVAFAQYDAKTRCLRRVELEGREVAKVAFARYDPRPGYLRRVELEVRELEADGYEIVWVGAGAAKEWRPPVGERCNKWQRKNLVANTPQQPKRPPEPIDALAIERQQLADMGLTVLGDDDAGFAHVFSTNTRKIAKLKPSQVRYADLLRLGGEKIRERVSENEDSAEEMKSLGVAALSVRDVRNAIALMASRRRIAPELAAGQGFHLGETGHGILVDAGGAAVWDYDNRCLKRASEPFVDGLLLDYSGGSAVFDFDSLQRRLGAMNRERFAEAARGLDRVLELWRWKQPGGHTLVTGLAMATFIQTAWKWRPQVSIRGESGSAKTRLFEVLAEVSGGLFEKVAKVTEAGLRQFISNRVTGILLDEHEEDKHRQRIYELVRTASRGEQILRGTAGGRPQSFGLRHMVWVAAIESGLTEQADRNRFIRVEIEPPKKWITGIPSDSDLRELGQEIIAGAIFYCREALEICERVKQLAIDGVEQRQVENFSVPTAMLAVSGIFPRATPEGILRSLIEQVADHSDESSEPDQVTLLRDILSMRVIVERETLTAGEILDEPFRCAGGRAALERDGLKRCGESMFVATKLVEDRLRGTRWQGRRLREILVRLPGAAAGKDVRRRCGGVVHAGVLVPWHVVEQFLTDGSEVDMSNAADCEFSTIGITPLQ